MQIRCQYHTVLLLITRMAKGESLVSHIALVEDNSPSQQGRHQQSALQRQPSLRPSQRLALEALKRKRSGPAFSTALQAVACKREAGYKRPTTKSRRMNFSDLKDYGTRLLSREMYDRVRHTRMVNGQFDAPLHFRLPRPSACRTVYLCVDAVVRFCAVRGKKNRVYPHR